VNRLVAFLDGPFSHVELVFPAYKKPHCLLPAKGPPTDQDTRVYYAASIFQGGTVFFKPKVHSLLCLVYDTALMPLPQEYKRDGYVCLGLSVTQQEHDALISYSRHAASKSIRFDLVGMASAWLPFVLVPHNPSATFCSKFVVDALHHAKVAAVQKLESRITTPSSLYRHICAHMQNQAVLAANPSKLKQRMRERAASPRQP
jgi:hypothetical protein